MTLTSSIFEAVQSQIIQVTESLKSAAAEYETSEMSEQKMSELQEVFSTTAQDLSETLVEKIEEVKKQPLYGGEPITNPQILKTATEHAVHNAYTINVATLATDLELGTWIDTAEVYMPFSPLWTLCLFCEALSLSPALKPVVPRVMVSVARHATRENVEALVGFFEHYKRFLYVAKVVPMITASISAVCADDVIVGRMFALQQLILGDSVTDAPPPTQEAVDAVLATLAAVRDVHTDFSDVPVNMADFRTFWTCQAMLHSTQTIAANPKPFMDAAEAVQRMIAARHSGAISTLPGQALAAGSANIHRSGELPLTMTPGLFNDQLASVDTAALIISRIIMGLQAAIAKMNDDDAASEAKKLLDSMKAFYNHSFIDAPPSLERLVDIAGQAGRGSVEVVLEDDAPTPPPLPAVDLSIPEYDMYGIVNMGDDDLSTRYNAELEFRRPTSPRTLQALVDRGEDLHEAPGHWARGLWGISMGDAGDMAWLVDEGLRRRSMVKAGLAMIKKRSNNEGEKEKDGDVDMGEAVKAEATG